MFKLPFYIVLTTAFLFCTHTSSAQLSENKTLLTHADTLRGSNGLYRQQWDVLKYDITVQPDFNTKTLIGKNTLTFYDYGAKIMQIDLQNPMQLDSVKNNNIAYTFTREGNVYWVKYRDTANNIQYKIAPGIRSLTFYFSGKPREAVRPPWDGGWIWKKDKEGNPWMTVACQGLGASVWYPCKDIQSDKPDSGAVLHIIAPDSLMAIGNGKMTNKLNLQNGFTQYTWVVKNPINNYCIIPYIGKYVNFNEQYNGLNGALNLNYWVMQYDLEKAKKQFTDVTKMMKAFEYWFGPYPFYEDGYQLIQAPHLGMEHQSAIAYGNNFKMGYAGKDLSGTGEGLKWDFIIVHESGHEWFANSICTKDIADMWVHEGFTNYSETLFMEYYWGKKAADIYVQGIRNNIENDIPIIGQYGVNKEGSGDMYYKGANMLHLIRQWVNNDVKFRAMLTGLNKTFYHKTVTTKEVEEYITKLLGLNLQPIFNQYLRTIQVPTVEYKIGKTAIEYRWINVVDNFTLPIKISTDSTRKKMITITPTVDWQKIKAPKKFDGKTFVIDKNYYVFTKQVL